VWDVGFLVGASLSDGDLAGGPSYGLGEVGPAAGVRGAHFLGGRWNWFADAVTSQHNTELSSGSANRVAGRTGVEFFLGRPGLGSWFFSGAAGYEKVDFKNDVFDLDRPLASLGVGQRIRLRNGTYFRWELRGEHLIGNNGLQGNTVDNGELLLGWSFGAGGSAQLRPSKYSERHPPKVKPTLAPAAPPASPGTQGAAPTSPPSKRRGPDTDGDGVPDRDDRCAFTPKGYPVDEHGCAKDSDGDGVPDGADQCPNTPHGAWVDAKGCPTDFDHDGVFDGVDRCPDTPPGVKVDEFGCPRPD
jgi:hypothetical protein